MGPTFTQEESDMTERLHFHFSLHALEKAMATHPVFLPGDSQGWRSLVGCRDLAVAAAAGYKPNAT